jgi:hypothetical protein
MSIVGAAQDAGHFFVPIVYFPLAPSLSSRGRRNSSILWFSNGRRKPTGSHHPGERVRVRGRS